MPPNLLLLLLPFLLLLFFPASASVSFAFNGFRNANLTLDGTAAVSPSGLLRLTNATKMLKAHAFYPSPIPIKNSSFSTTFVFAIQYTEISGHGIVLFFSRSTDFSSATGSQFLGLFNASNNMNSTNHVVGIELDTIQNPEFSDINNNHVGIDVNGLISFNPTPAGYFSDGEFHNLSLSSGDSMQLWVDYDGKDERIDVKLAPLGEPKPQIPLLSAVVDLSSIISDTMFVGFSASTDPFQTSHYIQGWSFNMSGEATLDLSALPSLPKASRKNRTIAIWLPILVVLVVISASSVVVIYVMHRIKFSDLVEDWEEQYGPHRFPFKILFDATKGFASSELLGSGGFGCVYKGYLPNSNTQIAVKRISHESRQGIKEFVAEIVSIGRVRHRNLVQLLGYCRRKGELMLVYEFMPNGSLDKLLFHTNTNPPLSWQQRLNIIKGVALGLQYLHEEWEQVVIHRDVKASNVLLDAHLNGRLGDFGLARLYDHGSDPHTTHIVGTMGYLAPELTRTSKATKATDVFAFGAFVLEVITGRRPIESRLAGDEEEVVVLVERVVEAWRRGAISEVVDGRMGGEWEVGEVERMVRVGLVCSHPVAAARPGMREVVRVLEGEAEIGDMAAQFMDAAELERLQEEAFGGVEAALGFEYAMSFATGTVVSSEHR